MEPAAGLDVFSSDLTTLLSRFDRLQRTNAVLETEKKALEHRLVERLQHEVAVTRALGTAQEQLRQAHLRIRQLEALLGDSARPTRGTATPAPSHSVVHSLGAQTSFLASPVVEPRASTATPESGRLAALSAEVSRLDAERRELRRELASARKGAVSSEELASLRRQLADAGADQARLRRERDDAVRAADRGSRVDHAEAAQCVRRAEEAEAEAVRLRAELTRLAGSYEDALAGADAAVHELSIELQAKEDGFHSVMHEAQDDVDTLLAEVERLKGALEEAQAAHQQHTAQRDALVVKHEALQEEHTRLAASLEGALQEAAAAVAARDKAQALVASLEERDTSRVHEMERAAQEIIAVDHEYAAHIAAVEGELMTAREHIARLERTNSDLRAELTGVLRRASQSPSAAVNMSADARATRRESLEQSAIRVELDQTRARTMTLTQERDANRLKAAQLKHKLKQYVARVHQLEEQLGTNHEARMRSHSPGSPAAPGAPGSPAPQTGAQEARMHALERALEEEREARAMLQRRLAEARVPARTAAAPQAAWQGGASSMRSTASSTIDDVDSPVARGDSHDALRRALQQERDASERLRLRVAALEEERDRSQHSAEQEALTRQVGALVEERGALHRRAQDLELHVSELDAERADLAGRLGLAEARLAQLQQEAEAAEAETEAGVDVVLRRHQELQDAFRRLEEQHEAAKEQLRRAELQITRMADVKSRMKARMLTEIRQRNRAFEDLKARFQALEGRLNRRTMERL